VLENEISRIQFQNLTESEIAQKVEMVKTAGSIICERAMKILEHVTDGSQEEGVSYGTYTSRGFFMYLALAKSKVSRLSRKCHKNLSRKCHKFRKYKKFENIRI